MSTLQVPRKVHLIAIGGTGMAALAGLFKEIGVEVRGSDGKLYPPVSTFLQREGIPVIEGFRPENLDWNPDLVVIGNAVPRTNPEAEETLHRGLPYASMPSALHDYFLTGRHPIVVTGTHGKTSTASLLAWVLESAGLDPGFFIGGFPENFARNYKLGSLAPQTPFVIEGDEYNTAFFDKGPKFLHYAPQTLLVNNIEFDHADIFPDIAAIESAFQKLAETVPGAGWGTIVANAEDARVSRVLAGTTARVIWYGDAAKSVYAAARVRTENSGNHFDVVENGGTVTSVRCGLYGRHNVMNALAVFAAARGLGLEPAAIAAGFASFRGLKRRMEIRGEIGGITVIDDFAHHPTAVAATVEAARERYPGRRLWAVFEPKSLTGGRRFFQERYVEAFSFADRIILGPIFYRDRFSSSDLLDLEELVEVLNLDTPEGDMAPAGAAGMRAQRFESNRDIPGFLAAKLEPADIVLVMSSGSFGGLLDTLLDLLKRRFGAV